MDAVTLARIQFAFTIGYHFIFVPISIGVGMMVVLSERRYYKSGIAADRAASNFWIKLFTATFAIGVATGITMEFAFGTNWADYSRFVGNIFGAPLAAEGLFAFFLESTFLGVLLFGRKRVSKRFYYVSAWLVWIGALLSALWILIANSWMQTPAGYKVEDGKAVLTSFWAAALNPSIGPRYFHTVAAALLTGCFVVAGVCAYYLLKKRHLHFARQAMLWAASRRPRRSRSPCRSSATGAPSWSPSTSRSRWPPSRTSATRRRTRRCTSFGWVRQATADDHAASASRAASASCWASAPTTRSPGSTAWPPADRPPVQLDVPELPPDDRPGRALHPRVPAWRSSCTCSGRLERARWLLWVLIACIPLSILAINMGWTAAEVGRQPWIVQGLLRTSDGVSPLVSAGQIWTTLGLFGLIYLVLFVAWLRIFLGIIKKGPEDAAEMLEAGDAPSARRPAPAGAGR